MDIFKISDQDFEEISRFSSSENFTNNDEYVYDAATSCGNCIGKCDGSCKGTCTASCERNKR